MNIETHRAIDRALCGEPEALSPGRARVRLQTTERMAADERGLVHGGFVFGLADYAAMLAVNDPNVVLGGAETRFVAPVRVGDVVDATAEIREEKGKKRVIAIEATVGERKVLTGTLTAFVLEQHVFDV